MLANGGEADGFGDFELGAVLPLSGTMSDLHHEGSGAPEIADRPRPRLILINRVAEFAEVDVLVGTELELAFIVEVQRADLIDADVVHLELCTQGVVVDHDGAVELVHLPFGAGVGAALVFELEGLEGVRGEVAD